MTDIDVLLQKKPLQAQFVFVGGFLTKLGVSYLSNKDYTTSLRSIFYSPHPN